MSPGGGGADDPGGESALLSGASRATVLVVGDATLDRYLRGDVERISPEAPVPVVRIREREERPGGAANVAAGVAALGAEARLVAPVGDDRAGRRLAELLGAAGVETAGLVTAPDRPTTVKSRVVGRDQQMLRLDRERREPLAAPVAGRLAEAAGAALDAADAVAVADYGKGALAGDAARRLLEAARGRSTPVVVDPARGEAGRYAGASVLKPNGAEAARAAGTESPPTGDRDLRDLRRELGVEHLLVTLGGDGMRLAGPAGSVRHLPAETVEVYDVTGAGDTVTAVLAALIPATGVEEAARAANQAAALEVQKLGARPVTREELLAARRRA